MSEAQRRNAMKLPRRQFLHLAAGAAAAPVISRLAIAQTYPTRPITLVVPIAAGGAVDTAARIIAEKLQPKRKQSDEVATPPSPTPHPAHNFFAQAPPSASPIP